MPCDTSRLQSVTLEKCDSKTMIAALSDMGLQPILAEGKISFGRGEWIDCKTGQSQLAWNRTANEIKVAYSKAIVQRTAKALGWPRS